MVSGLRIRMVGSAGLARPPWKEYRLHHMARWAGHTGLYSPQGFNAFFKVVVSDTLLPFLLVFGNLTYDKVSAIEHNYVRSPSQKSGHHMGHTRPPAPGGPHNIKFVYKTESDESFFFYIICKEKYPSQCFLAVASETKKMGKI